LSIEIPKNEKVYEQRKRHGETQSHSIGQRSASQREQDTPGNEQMEYIKNKGVELITSMPFEFNGPTAACLRMASMHLKTSSQSTPSPTIRNALDVGVSALEWLATAMSEERQVRL